MVSIHCRREIAKHGVTRLPFFSIDTISTPPLVAVKAIEVCAARRHMPTCGDWLDADVASSSIACDRALGWQQIRFSRFRSGHRGVLLAYLHVHKAMGSSICKAARANMAISRMPTDATACLWRWSPAVVRGEANETCDMLCPYMHMTANGTAL